jgi:bloom syndrome protein
LGKPITVDERLAGLTELEQDALRDFVDGAKSLRQDLMTKNGHRQAIFSDTILREMGLRLPTDLEDMKSIPGIRPEMVDRYGRKFMLLVDNTREMYGGNAPAPRGRAPPRQAVVEGLSDDDFEEEDDEQVYDPNHEDVIDLCGDSDDEVPPPAEESESDYSYGGESDDDGSEHRSHHFTQPLDPEVEEFNNRLTQTMAANAAAAKATAPKRASKASSFGPKKRGSYRKSSGSTGGKPYWAGVKKRASSKATSSKAPVVSKRAAAGGGGGFRRGGTGAGAGAAGGEGGGNGWSGIMAMPS